MTSLTATSGLLGGVGASSVTEDPVKPSLLDVVDRAIVDDNRKRIVEPVFPTCRDAEEVSWWFGVFVSSVHVSSALRW